MHFRIVLIHISSNLYYYTQMSFKESSKLACYNNQLIIHIILNWDFHILMQVYIKDQLLITQFIHLLMNVLSIKLLG